MKKIIFIAVSLPALILVLILMPKSLIDKIPKGAQRISSLQDAVQIKFGVYDAPYLEYFKEEKRELVNGKELVFYQRFYERDVPRHARARLTGFISNKDNKHLFFFSANGDSFILQKPAVNTKFSGQGKVIKIGNNLKDIVRTLDFFLPNPIDRHGIKDVTVYDDFVYVGYTDYIKQKNCTTAAVARAPFIDEEKLVFEKLYETECVNLNTGHEGEAAAHMVGARVIPTESEMFLSVGMLNNFNLPQSDDSHYGKILRIQGDKSNTNNPSIKKVTHVAKGVRNPQGLAKCDNNLFYSSHGPKGGDEVNFINLESKKLPINFGWPIASYGTHYDGTYGQQAPEYAPLYQDHTKQGFEESLLWFTPSVAPSQLVALPIDGNKCNGGMYLYMATMGYRNDPGQKSIHRYKIEVKDGAAKMVSSTVYPIGGRVRDIENDDTVIWFWDENRGGLGSLEK